MIPTPEQKAEARKLRRLAAKLVREQREERGWSRGRDVANKPCLVLNQWPDGGPSGDAQVRAAQIVSLRRRAAMLEHP
jgi:hypothetical protein